MRAFSLLLVTVLSGCSASDLVQNWSATPAPDLSQPAFRRIVADNIKTVFPNQAIVGELEISDPRPVDHLKGPAWLTCLKLDARGTPQIYAIFIQNSKIIDWRSGILMDQCHKASYTPLELPAAATRSGS